MIFAYVKNSDKLHQIKMLCKTLHEDLVTIGPKDLNTCVGSLIGIKIPGVKTSGKLSAGIFTPGKTAPIMYAMQEILIFSAVEDRKMDEFLSEYKKVGIEPILLKAVATPYNVKWSLYELIEHLVDEHNIMKNM